MQFKYTFKHMEALESIENYASKRFEHLDKFNLHKEMKVQFIFSVQRENQQCEVLIDSGGRHYNATAVDPTLYAAIDLAVEKIENQLRKEKEKIQSHHRFEHSNEGYLRRELADQALSYRMASGDHTKKR